MSDLTAYKREMQAKNESASKALAELAEENKRLQEQVAWLKERLRMWADYFEADGYPHSAEQMRLEAR